MEKTTTSRNDDALIFEMDDHVEVVYVMDAFINTLADTSESLPELKEPIRSEPLSSSLPIQVPSQPKWRSETAKLNTFVAPHILSLNSEVISGSLPSSRRSRLNPV